MIIILLFLFLDGENKGENKFIFLIGENTIKRFCKGIYLYDNDKYSYHGKTSLQSKFGHHDSKNELHYAYPLSYDHNQLLTVMKQRCNPSKVDDCCVMSSKHPLHSKNFGITIPKLHYAMHSLYHTIIINHYWR